MSVWNRIDRWLERLRPSPLALWGKLPTHADYVSHCASAEASLGWQRWLARHMPERAADSRLSSPGGSPWLHLSPAPVDLRTIPVAFVLPPGALAFSGRRHVVGVMADSRDSVGRPHPLLIYRCASLAWVREQGSRPGLPWWHAQAQLAEWWALMIDGDEPAASSERSWLRLCALATQLESEPPADVQTLSARLGRMLGKTPDAGSARADTALPGSHGLRGVKHLPWPGWPDGANPVARRAAFWQQDGNARIVFAADTMAGVLRHGARP